MECAYSWRQPLPVSRVNWQILLREQSKQSPLKLPSSMPVHKNLAGIPVQSCYFSPGGWVHVRALACMCQRDFFSCVYFHKKPGGHGTDCMGSTHISPLPANQSRQRSRGAPFASIFLIADQAGEALHPALFFPQSKLSPPVQ